MKWPFGKKDDPQKQDEVLPPNTNRNIDTQRRANPSSEMGSLKQTARMPKIVPPTGIMTDDSSNPKDQMKQAGNIPKALLSGSLKQTGSISRSAIESKSKLSIPESLIPPTKPSKPKPKIFYCPICEERMEAKIQGDVTIFVCDVCNGYWCPNSTLQRLSEIRPEEWDRHLAVKLKLLAQSRLEGELEILTKHSCPECKQNLLQKHYKKVIAIGVESCRKRCGTFVEKSTLEKIQVLNKIGI